ncbi:BppU family phage baseplate upper protein (plasmid) [Clostridium perfringens]
MAKKNLKVKVDTINGLYKPEGTIKQLDSVFFNIEVTEEGEKKDLTGQTIKLFARKSDGKMVEQSSGISITNAEQGELTIDLLNAAVQAPGYVYFELEISDSNGIISTADFVYKVMPKVGSDEAIESTNEVSTLKKVEAYVAKAKVELEEFKKLQNEILATDGEINTQESLRVEAETKRMQAEEARVESDKLRDEKVTEFGKKVEKLENDIADFAIEDNSILSTKFNTQALNGGVEIKQLSNGWGQISTIIDLNDIPKPIDKIVFTGKLRLKASKIISNIGFILSSNLDTDYNNISHMIIYDPTKYRINKSGEIELDFSLEGSKGLINRYLNLIINIDNPDGTDIDSMIITEPKINEKYIFDYPLVSMGLLSRTTAKSIVGNIFSKGLNDSFAEVFKKEYEKEFKERGLVTSTNFKQYYDRELNKNNFVHEERYNKEICLNEFEIDAEYQIGGGRMIFMQLMFDLQSVLANINKTDKKIKIHYKVTKRAQDTQLTKHYVQLFNNNNSDINSYSGGQILGYDKEAVMFSHGVTSGDFNVERETFDTQYRYSRICLTHIVDNDSPFECTIENLQFSIGGINVTNLITEMKELQCTAYSKEKTLNLIPQIVYKEELKENLDQEIKPLKSSIEELQNMVGSGGGGSSSGSSSNFKSRWRGKKYASIGDSITWQHNNQELEHKTVKGYQQKVVDIVGVFNTNYGYSGIAVTGSDGITSKLSTMELEDKNICTIFLGTNDWHYSKEIGAISDDPNNKETFYGAYKHTIEYVLNKNKDIMLVLMTPLKRSGELTNRNQKGLFLNDYVVAVRKLADYYALPCINLYGNSGLNELTLSNYTYDGLHPNQKGHDWIGEYIANKLLIL